MFKRIKQSALVFLLMVLAALAAKAFTPNVYLAKIRPKFALEEIVPRDFSDWREIKTGSVGVVNPQAAEALNKIYSQLLSRTYIHKSGAVVMLSIAYGEDQRSDTAVHYPEVCYPAQGFQVKRILISEVKTSLGTIPVKKISTVMADRRFEPVTYWTTIGDSLTVSGLEKRMIELRYGIRGFIPDGVLFRISTIDRDSERAYEIHERFIKDMIPVLGRDALNLFFGKTQGE